MHVGVLNWNLGVGNWDSEGVDRRLLCDARLFNEDARCELCIVPCLWDSEVQMLGWEWWRGDAVRWGEKGLVHVMWWFGIVCAERVSVDPRCGFLSCLFK
jgi:hypothetical protein